MRGDVKFEDVKVGDALLTPLDYDENLVAVTVDALDEDLRLIHYTEPSGNEGWKGAWQFEQA